MPPVETLLPYSYSPLTNSLQIETKTNQLLSTRLINLLNSRCAKMAKWLIKSDTV